MDKVAQALKNYNEQHAKIRQAYHDTLTRLETEFNRELAEARENYLNQLAIIRRRYEDAIRPPPWVSVMPGGLPESNRRRH